MTTFLVTLLTVAMALCVPTIALPQATATPPAEPSLRTFFPDFAADVRRLPSNTGSGLSLAVGSILSASIYPIDHRVLDWEPQDVFIAGTVIGNGFFLAGGTLAAYGVGHWGHKPRVRLVAADMLRAQALTLAIVFPLKYSVQRQRPDGTTDDSFPSGHTAQTFAAATVMARHLGKRTGWPALATAAFVGTARLNRHRHFISDVVYGAAIGVAAGWNAAHPASQWTVTPSAGASHFEFRVTRVFAP